MNQPTAIWLGYILRRLNIGRNSISSSATLCASLAYRYHDVASAALRIHGRIARLGLPSPVKRILFTAVYQEVAWNEYRAHDLHCTSVQMPRIRNADLLFRRWLNNTGGGGMPKGMSPFRWRQLCARQNRPWGNPLSLLGTTLLTSGRSARQAFLRQRSFRVPKKFCGQLPSAGIGLVASSAASLASFHQTDVGIMPASAHNIAVTSLIKSLPFGAHSQSGFRSLKSSFICFLYASNGCTAMAERTR